MLMVDHNVVINLYKCQSFTYSLSRVELRVYVYCTTDYTGLYVLHHVAPMRQPTNFPNNPGHHWTPHYHEYIMHESSRELVTWLILFKLRHTPYYDSGQSPETSRGSGTCWNPYFPGHTVLRNNFYMQYKYSAMLSQHTPVF